MNRAEKDRTHSYPNKLWPAIINAINNQSRYYEKKANRRDDSFAHLIGFWTIVTALGTWGAVIMAGVAACVFWMQLQTMEGTLDETRGEQRPWVIPREIRKITTNEFVDYEIKFRDDWKITHPILGC